MESCAAQPLLARVDVFCDRNFAPFTARACTDGDPGGRADNIERHFSGRTQRRKIRALGLEQFISCRVITDELGREFWKPSLEPYRRVMAQFPGPAEGYVYIGDNPRKDFIGARQLGWRTVRVRRAEGEHADYQPIATEAAEAEIVNLLSLRQLLSPKAKAPSR